MNTHAQCHGLAVLYPGRARGANTQSCWNWFSKADQRRNRGKPAILSGMAEHIIAQHSIPSGRVSVAGLSAGGALVVNLPKTYREVFATFGVQSVPPFGAASDVALAFAAPAGHQNGGGIKTGGLWRRETERPAKLSSMAPRTPPFILPNGHRVV